MSFQEWEGTMGPAERYHRKLMWLAEIQANEKDEDEEQRRRWLDAMAPPKPEDFRIT